MWWVYGLGITGLRNSVRKFWVSVLEFSDYSIHNILALALLVRLAVATALWFANSLLVVVSFSYGLRFRTRF